MSIKLSHFDGKPLAYSFDTLERCLATPAREGLFIIERNDETGEWKILYHGTKEFGWVEHTLAQTSPIITPDTVQPEAAPSVAETKKVIE